MGTNALHCRSTVDLSRLMCLKKKKMGYVFSFFLYLSISFYNVYFCNTKPIEWSSRQQSLNETSPPFFTFSWVVLAPL